jgi:hypothetical protein
VQIQVQGLPPLLSGSREDLGTSVFQSEKWEVWMESRVKMHCTLISSACDRCYDSFPHSCSAECLESFAAQWLQPSITNWNWQKARMHLPRLVLDVLQYFASGSKVLEIL